MLAEFWKGAGQAMISESVSVFVCVSTCHVTCDMSPCQETRAHLYHISFPATVKHLLQPSIEPGTFLLLGSSANRCPLAKLN